MALFTDRRKSVAETKERSAVVSRARKWGLCAAVLAIRRPFQNRRWICLQNAHKYYVYYVTELCNYVLVTSNGTSKK